MISPICFSFPKSYLLGLPVFIVFELIGD